MKAFQYKRGRRGQGLTEYGFILAFIALAFTIGALSLSTEIKHVHDCNSTTIGDSILPSS